ncbi:hypothetical protein BH10PAT3_BH10PAT3_5490 [soil metagenome]
MKKLILIAVAVFSLFTLFVSFRTVASAASFDPLDNACNGVPVSGADASSVCADKANNTANPLTGTDGILIKAVRIVTLLTGIASVIVIIISGLKYITSNGDSNSINSAKNTMLYAIIGVVVSLMSQAIILFVLNKLN